MYRVSCDGEGVYGDGEFWSGEEGQSTDLKTGMAVEPRPAWLWFVQIDV